MTGDGPTTVLVVDDEPNVIEAYALWLGDEYDVRKAHDGEEALEALDGSIDVVLLDRLMPGLTGNEVLERIRGRGLSCRVAMVTAVEPDFDILEMPFDAYLKKPVSEAELRETVERLSELGTTDDRLRELFAVAQKRSALETTKGSTALAESDEYDRLQRRFEELREELDARVAAMDDEGLAAMLRDGETDRAREF